MYKLLIVIQTDKTDLTQVVEFQTAQQMEEAERMLKENNGKGACWYVVTRLFS